MPHEPIAEPEPVPVPVESGPNENDVKIAEIEAAARVETEKIWTEQRSVDLAAEVERQAGELKGMREILDRLAPEPAEPEPIPIPVSIPAPAPAAELEPPAPPDAGPSRKQPVKKGFF